MLRPLLFAIPALAVFALAPAAHATSIYVYDLSSGPSYLGSGVSGSITIEGNNGATLPLLDSASVLSWNFTVDGFVHWDSSTAQVQANNLSFNGTLGATTLQGTAGQWQIYYGPQSNAYFVLYGQPGPPFSERWGWCTSTQNCGDVGYDWKLTLASATPEAPEPSTAALLMGAVAAFGVARARRTKRV